jgi:amidase
VGLKPSRGRITLGPDMGDHPFAVEGCVSREIADTAAFLDVVAGPSPGDAVFPGPPVALYIEQLAGGPRRMIGLCTAPQFDSQLDTERVATVQAVADQLAAHGHHIEEISPNPWPGESIADSFLDVFALGIAAFAAIGEMVTGQQAGPDNLEPLTWAMVARGRALSAVQLAMAQDALHRWSVAVDSAIARYDAVLTPTIPGPPLPIGAIAEKGADISAGMGLALRFAAFTPVANITGRPALAIPAGFDRAGLPLSVQLIGRHADEVTLLSLGAELERIDHPTKEAV